jgi:hypothetical protein
LLISAFAQLRESIKPDDYSGLQFIAELAPWWPTNVLDDAIAWIDRASEGRYRSTAFGAILRRLIQLGRTPEAFRVIREKPWRRDNGALIKEIADRLPADALTEAFTLSLEQRTPAARAEAIAALAPRLAGLPHATIVSLLRQLLAAEEQGTRPELIQTLAAFAPALAGNGQQQAIVKLAMAIQDVGHSWP